MTRIRLDQSDMPAVAESLTAHQHWPPVAGKVPFEMPVSWPGAPGFKCQPYSWFQLPANGNSEVADDSSNTWVFATHR